MTFWTLRYLHKLRDAFFSTRALSGSKRVQNEVFGTGKSTHIVWLFAFFDRIARLLNVVFRIDRYCWRIICKQNPITRLFRQCVPWFINIIAQRSQYTAEVLTLPCWWPSCNRTLTDGLGIVWHQQLFSDLKYAADT